MQKNAQEQCTGVHNWITSHPLGDCYTLVHAFILLREQQIVSSEILMCLGKI